MKEWRRDYEVRPHSPIGNKPPISLLKRAGAIRPPLGVNARKIPSRVVQDPGAAGVDPVSPDSRRLGLGTEAQELAW
jgi:hypothetical protein